MTLNLEASRSAATSGPPKIRKNASKKNKKSWRKNVDMTEVEAAIDEKLLDERLGGSLLSKQDAEIFMLDTGGQEAKEKRKKRKEMKKLKCHSLLDGLPGVPDPKPNRPHTRTPAERINPVVAKKLKAAASAGRLPAKFVTGLAHRAEAASRRKATEAERATRRRTKFDFDLWDDAPEEAVMETKAAAASAKKADEAAEVDTQWITPETVQHTAVWTNKMKPKAAKNRDLSTSTLLPAVEVPHPGQSYNPNLKDHQELLWTAAIVEMDKEKEQRRIERQTTEMFPTKDKAPTKESFLKEMAEGIVELGGESKEDDEDEEEVEENEDEGCTSTARPPKPKTRQQKRDARTRGFEARRLEAVTRIKNKEAEVTRIKSMKKELRAAEEATKERQAKKELIKRDKLMMPTQLSQYKYKASEIELKLSSELTGNLRNLKPEGSVLEDRYKSMQRRNIVETRVVQKASRAKTKKVDKRSHKMGWEAEYSAAKNARKQRRNAKLAKAASKKFVHER